MNLALICDRVHVKTFWEKRIDSDSQDGEKEEQRMKRSKLQKLRGEWLVRLEARDRNLRKDKYVKKVKVETPDETNTVSS